MLHLKQPLATAATTLMLALGVAACGGTAASTDTTASGTATQPAAATATATPAGAGVDVASVSTVDELVALVQEAYGEASLGLHRGHQDVESTLTEVLGVSHDELHVRMETQGQNLAAVAEDVGVDQQELVDALVATRSPAVEALVEAGTITQAQGEAYLEQLEEAYTYRVTWDGEAATPTASVV